MKVNEKFLESVRFGHPVDQRVLVVHSRILANSCSAVQGHSFHLSHHRCRVVCLLQSVNIE